MSAFDEVWTKPEFETVASLSQQVVYRLPGCDDTAVRFALRESYKDFCEKSCALVTTRRFSVGEVGTSSDSASYPIEPNYVEEDDDASETSTEESVRVIPVHPLLPDFHVEVVKEVWVNRRQLTQGRDFYLRDNLIILRHEWSDCRFVIKTVEVPDTGCESAPEWFLKKYGDAICSGALARLMLQTGKAWTDAAQGQTELMNFNNAASVARFGYYGGSALANGAMAAGDGFGSLL